MSGGTIKPLACQGFIMGQPARDPQQLTDWINAQRLINPLICLGDGHDGVWNLFAQIGTKQQRQEIRGLVPS